MAVGKPVPTVEEIREMQERQKKGLSAIATRGETNEKIDALATRVQQQVDSLTKEVKKKRLSAVELADNVQAIFNKYQFNPVEELVKLVTEKQGEQFVLDVQGDKKLRVNILQTLMEYAAPKLKSVEVSGSVDHKHEITILRFGEDGIIQKEKDGKIIDITAEATG